MAEQKTHPVTGHRQAKKPDTLEREFLGRPRCFIGKAKSRGVLRECKSDRTILTPAKVACCTFPRGAMSASGHERT